LSEHDFRPGIFWTWQDRQVQERAHVAQSVADMVERGFGKLLVQPRGCRYAADDPSFIAAVAHASEEAVRHGAELWLHLDPRSLAGSVVEHGGATDFLIVAGTGEGHKELPLDVRPLDVEVPLGADGTFEIRLDYPATRPYHVHSDGAIRFTPRRLERCFAYRLNGSGELVADSVRDISADAHLFTNELSGYVEVFGRWQPPTSGDWHVLAATSFASNYPDFASPAMRAHLAAVLDRYAAADAKVSGLWWDEPGYCTGFDRRFRSDRGRLPWSGHLLERYRARTGREALDDLPFLLRESDDGRWGEVRERFYLTIQDTVFSAQEDLLKHARYRLGEGVRMGVHQTWHQNADDVINGCADWWRGSSVLEAGYTDVGDAERIDDPRQMAEVRAMACLAVSLGRHSATGESYFNLWGVDYGGEADLAAGQIIDWWADLQAAIGCNWLAHTYGPTGYFERPSVWGPGYPDHPTWSLMPAATSRLARALELSDGRSPVADVAFTYPLGTMYRLGSDMANPLSDGTHLLIDTLLRAGFELDIVSPEMLRSVEPGRYRAILYAHPFGAKSEDVAALGRWREHGTRVIAHGLPPVAGAGYAGPAEWSELGVRMPELGWYELRSVGEHAGHSVYGGKWHYAETPGWGRPVWSNTDLSDRPQEATYVPLFLHGLGDAAIDLLAHVGLEPAWRLPRGAVASRTALEDGGTVVRLAPAEFGVPFEGELELGEHTLAVGPCDGLFVVVMLPGGRTGPVIAPKGVSWDLRPGGASA